MAAPAPAAPKPPPPPPPAAPKPPAPPPAAGGGGPIKPAPSGTVAKPAAPKPAPSGTVAKQAAPKPAAPAAPAKPYEGPEWWKKMKPAQKFECLKCIFYVVNTLICVLALQNVAVASIQLSRFKFAKTDAEPVMNPRVKAFQTSGFTGMLVGIITLLQSSMGCFGMAWSNRCMLLVYLLLSGILVVLCLFMMSHASYEIHKFKTIGEQLLQQMEKYDGKKTEETYYIDQNQVMLRCCGVNGYSDFKDTPWGKGKGATKLANQVVPLSCCQLADDERRKMYSFETMELKLADLIDSTCPTSPMGKANAVQPCLGLIEQREKLAFVLTVIDSVFSGLMLVAMMGIAIKVRESYVKAPPVK